MNLESIYRASCMQRRGLHVAETGLAVKAGVTCMEQGSGRETGKIRVYFTTSDANDSLAPPDSTGYAQVLTPLADDDDERVLVGLSPLFITPFEPLLGVLLALCRANRSLASWIRVFSFFAGTAAGVVLPGPLMRVVGDASSSPSGKL